MRGRTIAIGDIHGCAAALDALLAWIKPRPTDLIVTLGDYIDRGSQSRLVLDRLIDLKGRCQLVPILGNHDEMLLRLLDQRDDGSGPESLSMFLGMGGGVTLDSYGPGHDASLIPAQHREFLANCHPYHENLTHILLHANYDPDLPMVDQPDGLLRWESLRNSTPGRHQSGKTVIAGHTSQKNGEILDLGHLKCIDTYCYGGGWLTALDVRTDEVWQVDRTGQRRRDR